jgi:uncharacterized membrane protein
MLYLLCLALVLVFLPALVQRFVQRWKIDRVLSDVVVCYLVGIVFASTKAYWWPSEHLEASHQLSKTFAEVSVLLAIPILLMINPARQWLSHTGEMLKAFLVGVLCVAFWSGCMGWFYQQRLEEAHLAAGMLAGVFTGGTPNMVAVHKALGGSENLFIMVNAADTLCSGLYVIFLTSFGKRFFSLFLPSKERAALDLIVLEEKRSVPWALRWSAAWKTTLLAMVVVALSVVLGSLFPDDKGQPNQLVVMLSLSTLGVLASFSPKVTALSAADAWAHYLLLIFAMSAGALADFGEVLVKGGVYVQFTALVLFGMLILYFGLARLLRLDRDTCILASTAAIFGPPFVSQVGAAIKAEGLIPAGVAMGVLGLALGNYVGLLTAGLVLWWGG